MSDITPQISTNWNATQVEYMTILADPLESRTDEEIADYLKVDRKTMWNWRQTEGFCDEAYEILKKNIAGKLGKVFSGLLRRAERGDSSAARLILEAISKLKTQGTKEGDKTLNVYIGTPEQEQEIDEYVITRSNEMIREGKAKIENGEVMG